jgi:hypothetical protein
MDSASIAAMAQLSTEIHALTALGNDLAQIAMGVCLVLGFSMGLRF